VIRRLEDRGLVERFPCPDDARATNVRLTAAGWDKVRRTAPGHVTNVRQHVIDALTPEQVRQLAGITEAILRSLDPDGAMAAMYHRYGRVKGLAELGTAGAEVPVLEPVPA
jgi:hypothetical protein